MTRNEALLKEGERNVRVGGLWLGGGSFVTLFSLMLTDEGGRYVLAWGAIVFGGIQLFRGLSQVARAKLARTREVVCPFCHEGLELDESEMRQMQYTCPECGHQVHVASADLTHFGDTGQSKGESAGETKEVVCPHCKEALELDENEIRQQHYTCPECGSNVELGNT